MGGLQTLVLMGGGAQSAPPPIFICENHRKSNEKIMHCVEKIYLIGSFKDKAIFHVILEIWRFFSSNNFMNLYSKTFYILNFQKKKKIMVK